MIVKQKIHFIINPISGGLSKTHIPDLIFKVLDKNIYDIQIFYTQGQESNHHLAAASAMEADVIVAVGGDGTINNVAQYVANTNKIFGVIPMGSGNGLARELNIPTNPEKALQLINQQKIKAIDTCKANNQFFINIAGVGFDAHIADLFAKAKTRGFKTYAKITLKEFARYKNRPYQIQYNGQQEEINAFMVCICNGTQFGNNAYAAPKAIYNDGLFDVVIFNAFKIWQVPLIAYKLFKGDVSDLPFVKTFKTNHISISRYEKEVANIDGEAMQLDKDIHFKIFKQNLKVFAG
ncbi:MAG: diacylglycerol kinase family protein [Candidatus Methylacidiphilales bacterium]